MNENEQNETDWQRIYQLSPDIYSTFFKIKDLNKALRQYYVEPDIWNSDNEANFTYIAAIVCQQRIIDDIQNHLKDLEEKHEIIRENDTKWIICHRHRFNIVFLSRSGDLVEIPQSLLKQIRENIPFDGQIFKDGKFIIYKNKDKIIAKIPIPLYLKIIDNKINVDDFVPSDDEVEK